MSAFADLCGLIERRIGFSVNVRQERSLETFIAARTQRLGLPDAAAYCRLLNAEPLDGHEFSRLIAAVTNGHTFFFRDGDQLTAAGIVLQQLYRSRGQPLQLWSAGCSTGEEPYSVAMLCADLHVEARVLASDINRESLEFAQKARYRDWSLRHLPLTFRERFVVPQQDTNYIADPIRDSVRFTWHNLADPLYPRPRGGTPRWDAILCRNVLTYFEGPRIERVAAFFADVLAPDGWLFLSTTENLSLHRTPFVLQPLGTSTGYQLRDAPAAEVYPLELPPAVRSPAEQLLWSASGPLDPTGMTPWPFPRAVQIPTPATRPTPRDQPSVPPEVQARAQQAYDEAVAYIERGELAQAELRLAELLTEHPQHVLGRLTHGNLLLRAHSFEAALAAYQKAQQADPLLPEAHYLQGIIFRKMGDLERAVHAFRRALFLEPRFWHASYMLAGVYGRLGLQTQRRRNLTNTLAALVEGPDAHPFISHVRGMRDVDLAGDEVEQLCRRYLAE